MEPKPRTWSSRRALDDGGGEETRVTAEGALGEVGRSSFLLLLEFCEEFEQPMGQGETERGLEAHGKAKTDRF